MANQINKNTNLKLDIFNMNIIFPVQSDLTCTICTKILKNACQSPCGCRYCELCIRNYLNGEEKCCPRKSDDCKEQILNFKRDIVIDHVANKRISIIKVKCPEKFCEFRDELRKMTEHIKSHKEQCPYIDMGCNKPKCEIKTMTDHLNRDNYLHSTMLMESIQNLKNKISCMKDDSLKKELSINVMKDQITNLQSDNLILKQAIVLIKENLLQETRNKIKKLTETVKGQQEIIAELQEKNVNRKCSTEQNIGMHVESIKTNTATLSHLSNIVKMNSNKKKITKIDLGYGYSYPLIGPLNEFQPEYYRTISFDYYKTDPNYTSWPFYRWKIEDYRKKVEDARRGGFTELWSEPFYSDSKRYKMILIANPGYSLGKGCYLSVFACIIKGKYDDVIPWPMKDTVVIGLGNINSIFCVNSCQYSYDTIEEKYRYVFNKPTGDIYYAFGKSEFHHVNCIFNNGKIYQSNSILLTCFVKNS